MTEQSTDEQNSLMKFYQVETLADLVIAQKHHIENLQDKLREMQQPLPNNYWTGPKPRG